MNLKYVVIHCIHGMCEMGASGVINTTLGMVHIKLFVKLVNLRSQFGRNTDKETGFICRITLQNTTGYVRSLPLNMTYI